MLAVLTVWSPWSVLTVVGILYFVLLFAWWIRRGICAWCWILILWVVGMVLPGLMTPGGASIDDAYADVRPRSASYYDHMYNVGGKWIVERDLLRANKLPPSTQEPVYRGTIEAWGLFWHPACLAWCPLVVLVVAIPLWPILQVPLLGYCGLRE